MEEQEDTREITMRYIIRIERIDKIQRIWPDLFIEETDGRYTWYTKKD
jgi:hypothetical protein